MTANPDFMDKIKLVIGETKRRKMSSNYMRSEERNSTDVTLSKFDH